MSKKTHKIECYSMLDSKIAGMTGLFHSVDRQEINKVVGWEAVRRIQTKDGDDIEFKFGGNRLLTMQDQSVFLGILYLVAKPDHGDDKESHKNKVFVFPNERDIEKIEGNAASKKIGKREVTITALLKASGMKDSGGKNSNKRSQLKESLNRLGSVTIGYINHTSRWVGKAGFIGYDYKDDRLILTVNWRIAGAIFDCYHYVKIDLDERQQLKKESDQRLHIWLSNYIWTGETKDVMVDTLIDHVWPKKSTSQGTINNRRSEISNGLKRIGAFAAWSVTIVGRGKSAKATISRANEPEVIEKRIKT